MFVHLKLYPQSKTKIQLCISQSHWPFPNRTSIFTIIMNLISVFAISGAESEGI